MVPKVGSSRQLCHRSVLLSHRSALKRRELSSASENGYWWVLVPCLIMLVFRANTRQSRVVHLCQRKLLYDIGEAGLLCTICGARTGVGRGIEFLGLNLRVDTL